MSVHEPYYVIVPVFKKEAALLFKAVQVKFSAHPKLGIEFVFIQVSH